MWEWNVEPVFTQEIEPHQENQLTIYLVCEHPLDVPWQQY